MAREAPANTNLSSFRISAASSALAVIMTESPLICDYLTLDMTTLKSVADHRTVVAEASVPDSLLVAGIENQCSERR